MTIIAIIVTWYLTKVYYSKKITFNLNEVERDHITQICFSCGKYDYIHKTNLRSPHYCMGCR